MEKEDYAFAMLDPNGAYTQYGLTKREYFASMAMQSVTSPKIFVGTEETKKSFSEWSKMCVMMADELLTQLQTNKK